MAETIERSPDEPAEAFDDPHIWNSSNLYAGDCCHACSPISGTNRTGQSRSEM